MTGEIDSLVSAIETGRGSTEVLERDIARVAGLAFAGSRRLFLSDVEEAMELPSRQGWSFALSSGKSGSRRYFGAFVFKPGTQDEVLAQAEAMHPAQAVVVAFLRGMKEMRRQSYHA